MNIPLRRPGRTRLLHRISLVLVGGCLVTAFGCGHKPTAPRAVATSPAPVPSTPIAVADFLQWCWQNRSADQYGLIFSEDFVFEFAVGDSAGNFYRSTPWGRSDELLMAVHLFRDGTPSKPPASSITLDFTQEPTNEPDARPGKNPRWHRFITTQVLLRVNLPDGTQEIRGAEYFFMVRGDSAQISPELAARGVRPDSTRWWIERWVDGSLQSAPAESSTPSPGRENAMPGRKFTLGQLKALYR